MKGNENPLFRCKAGCKLRVELEAEMNTVTRTWERTVDAALSQNNKLKTACNKTREVLDLIQEINNFLDQVDIHLS